MDVAWQRHFKKIGDAQRPRFKKKGKSRDSIRFVNFNKYCKLEGRRVKLPAGLGWVNFRKSRNVHGTVKNCTIGFDGGHWFISFQTERQVETPTHPSRSMIGVDVGIARFITLSDGSFVEPVSSFKAHQHRLAKAQRGLARKVKFSGDCSPPYRARLPTSTAATDNVPALREPPWDYRSLYYVIK
ncbi:MAG: transposase, partial [Halomonas subglaciescola]|nr:transposase [Halomonas subglaciescola]